MGLRISMISGKCRSLTTCIVHTSHCLAAIDDHESGRDVLEERPLFDIMQAFGVYVLKIELFSDLAQGDAKSDGGNNVKCTDSKIKPRKRCYRL